MTARLCAVCLCVMTTPALGAGKPVVAVLPLEVQAMTLDGPARSTLLAPLKARLSEGYRLLPDDAARPGKAGLDRVVSVHLQRRGRACLTTGTLANARTHATMRMGTARGRCHARALAVAMTAVAHKLVDPLSAADPAPMVLIPAGTFLRGYHKVMGERRRCAVICCRNAAQRGRLPTMRQ